jgi:periplasmic divalent cation tolerance protein
MPVPAADLRLILTTTGSREEAEHIARSLVDEYLAACVSIVPGLTSIYRWKGDLETASEFLVLIKATAANLDRLESALCRLHSYETPEFLVFTPESAAQPYLEWLTKEGAGPR